MFNKFSINDLVAATNKIFEIKPNSKKYLPKSRSSKTKDERIQKSAPIPKDTESIIKQAESVLKNKKQPVVIKDEVYHKIEKNEIPSVIQDFTAKLKEDDKSIIINELYKLFKKKVKKNTLKVILDQQLEIKNFKKKISFLATNIDELESYYKAVKIQLTENLKNQKSIEIDNKVLELKYKELKGILRQSTNNNNLLLKNSKMLKNILEKSIQDKKLLEIDNKNFELNYKDLNIKLQNKETNNMDLNKNNQILANDLAKLKINLGNTKLGLLKSIQNNKFLKNNSQKLLNKLELIKKSKNNDKLIDNQIDNFEKIKSEANNNLLINETNNKLKFYQDENVRLSSELTNTQNRHDILKTNMTKIEIEKNNISNQIQELNDSLNNTNIVKTPFLKEIPQEITEDLKHMNSDEKKNLDDVVNKIFKKLEE